MVASAVTNNYFYPRPPRGGRPLKTKKRNHHEHYFYPRPPRGGRRNVPRADGLAQKNFYPRPPRGGRLEAKELAKELNNFYPRPPRGGRPMPEHIARLIDLFLSTPSARRATAKTERKPSAFVSLYTSLHKLQRGACKTNRKITPLLVQTAGIPVRSLRENHVRCLFALAGHQKISTLSCANSGCSPTCSTLVW